MEGTTAPDGVAGWPQRRLLRAGDGAVATSLLPVPSAAALRAVRWEPVGDVTGCVVMLVRRFVGACGRTPTPLGLDAPPAPVVSSGDDGGPEGLRPRAAARTTGLTGALERMLAQAAVLDADGVVDVRLTETGTEHQMVEFVAAGTAVRVSGGLPSGGRDGPFATTLDGPATAAALSAGWGPTGVAVGVAAALRHQDQFSRSGAGQAVGSFVNAELSGLTDLLTTARADARSRLHEAAVALGGGDLAVTRFDTRTGRQSITDGHVDDTADVTVVATVLRHAPSGHRDAVRQVRAVLPLTDPRRSRPAPARDPEERP